MINVIRVLLSLGLLFSYVYAEKINLNKIEYSNDIETEKLYFIGFNNERFAYIKHVYKEGVGDYYWQINIQNFKTNKVRVEEEFSSSGFDEKNVPESVLKKVHDLIMNNSFQNIQVALLSFPQKVNVHVVNAYLEMKSEQDKGGILVQTKNLKFEKDSHFIKNIAEVKSLTFFGHKKYFDFKVVGFLRTLDRILILVSYKRQEDEESRVITSVKLFSTQI